jgi:Methyltransferase domain
MFSWENVIPMNSTSCSLFLTSFLPWGLRFLFRHPTKTSLFLDFAKDYFDRYEKISFLTDKSIEEVVESFYQFERNSALVQGRGGSASVPMQYIVMYSLVRLIRPDIVLETGVHEGWSAWYTLLAMEENNHGILHSVDLPNQDVELIPGDGHHQREFLPEEKGPGWRVPQSLRARWSLHIGDAKEILPALLPSLGPIDIFVHDSLHTYDHMLFEYRAAWPFLKTGGLLLADDVDLNSSMSDFAQELEHPYTIFNFRPRPNSLVAIRKEKS